MVRKLWRFTRIGYGLFESAFSVFVFAVLFSKLSTFSKTLFISKTSLILYRFYLFSARDLSTSKNTCFAGVQLWCRSVLRNNASSQRLHASSFASAACAAKTFLRQKHILFPQEITFFLGLSVRYHMWCFENDICIVCKHYITIVQSLHMRCIVRLLRWSCLKNEGIFCAVKL